MILLFQLNHLMASLNAPGKVTFRFDKVVTGGKRESIKPIS